MRAWAALPLLLLGAGCLRVQWRQSNVDEPVAETRVEPLQVGSAELGRCLAALGAPTRVWEIDHEGMALAWGWLDETGWGIAISYSFDQFMSASFDYDAADRRIEGVVLMFDRDLVLREIRRGVLADIAADTRRRPALVEDAGG